MPCTQMDHTHIWPESGPLTIERCETFCQYCPGAEGKHKFKFAWFLRRHVHDVHIAKPGADHLFVQLKKQWTRSPADEKKPAIKSSAKQRAAKKRNATPDSYNSEDFTTEHLTTDPMLG
ncbi:hypothetical protein BAUCODRAFT_157538 [Baudoinia panamericana UAMH 10762]|uniref:Uncharacterized protein n=1 Tax=Baudoinia panamericana (strain UAMH 10762) TaxID=717646 RepID=M2LL84_BAUPA|nr:uncharacterized protein BAUCODRAFT_157538 [Baudoinia panamericana UAMH 10762]EMC95017.1 hypothetical protein BAUCODRAFT_157538 [Baudoinia panamericana UAMH 10762]